jgi:hypothetical protein
MLLPLSGAASAAPSPLLWPFPPLQVVLPYRQSLCRALVLVAGGGRDLEWSPVRVATVLKEATAGRLVHRVFHGDCRGADHTIEIAATRLGWPVQSIRAQWDRYGDAAGPKRNGQMLRRATEEARRQPLALPTGVLVIAFPGGAGTASLLEQARRWQARTPLPIEILDLGAGAQPPLRRG